jgi:hypothetical protein
MVWEPLTRNRKTVSCLSTLLPGHCTDFVSRRTVMCVAQSVSQLAYMLLDVSINLSELKFWHLPCLIFQFWYKNRNYTILWIRSYTTRTLLIFVLGTVRYLLVLYVIYCLLYFLWLLLWGVSHKMLLSCSVVGLMSSGFCSAYIRMSFCTNLIIFLCFLCCHKSIKCNKCFWSHLHQCFCRHINFANYINFLNNDENNTGEFF